MASARSSELRKYEPLLLFLGVTLLLFLGRELLIPLAFALTLCFLLLPAIRLLEERRAPRSLAVAIIGTVTCLVLVLGAYVLSRQVLQLAQTLPQYRDNMQRRIAALHSPAQDSIERAISTLKDVGESISPGSSAPAGQPVRLVSSATPLEFASDLLGLLMRPLAEVGIVIIFAMYMLMRREELRQRMLMLAGTGQLGVMTRAMDEAAHRISRYLVMQLEVNACYGLLFGIGLHIIGVPNAILWGVISGSLRLIPYVGTAAGMLLPLVAAVAVSSTWGPPALVVIWFVVLELTTAYVLEPRIFSTRTGISSLALLVSAIFWTMLWGWPGLALATPMTVCVVVMGQYVPQLGFLHSLLGTDAQLSPAAHFYERLLATDNTEAYAIAERFLRDRPLIELYDSVLVPTLNLAKTDRHRGTLDESRYEFLLLSLTELLALFSDLPAAAAKLPYSSNGHPKRDFFRSPVAKEIAVVCISAPETPDQLTTQILTQVLEHEKFAALALTTDALSDDVLSALAAEKDTVIIISALPPFAFAQARAICQRVRQYLGENRIAIAIWSRSDDNEETVSRFGPGRPDAVVATLAQVLVQIAAWQELTRTV